MYTLTTLLDGGYLSWVWGTKAGRTNSWNQARFKYHGTGLIIMDPPGELMRSAFDPDYKRRRRDKRKRSEFRQYRSELVNQFRETLREDPVVPVVEVPGYEADDIVALTWMNSPQEGSLWVVGVDKDFLQIPGLSDRMVDVHGQRTRDGWVYGSTRLFPQYAMRCINNSRDFIFAQVMLGDSSDSIPRLIPRNRQKEYEKLAKSEAPLRSAYETYGDQVVRNLQLLLIPHISLRVEEDWQQWRDGGDPTQLIDIVDANDYWDPLCFVDPRQLPNLGILRSKFGWY